MAESRTYRSTIQSQKILALLRSAHGAWVPLPEILACAAQYNARIFELRKKFNIENRTETVDGVRHSWFRLVTSPAAPAPEPAKPQPLKSWEQICAEREKKMSEPEPSFELTP